jgi:hypothetical protein
VLLGAIGILNKLTDLEPFPKMFIFYPSVYLLAKILTGFVP